MTHADLLVLDPVAVFSPLAGTVFTPGLLDVVQRLAEQPSMSFPRALGGALYKCFQRIVCRAGKLKVVRSVGQSGPVHPSVFLQPAQDEAWRRASIQKVVLAVEDTTECKVGGKTRRKGLGRLNKNDQGFLAHTCLGVSADGQRLPLGVLGMEALVRSEKNLSGQTALERYTDPDKESTRWLRLMRVVDAHAAAHQVQVIHVCDREADDYETFADCMSVGRRAILRLNHDRLLFSEPGAPAGPRKVSEAFSTCISGICERMVHISARASDGRTDKAKTHPGRTERMARLRFDAMTMDIKRPANAPADLPPSVRVNLVRVSEVDAPAGEDPIEWTLVTTEPISTVEQVLFVVDSYRARWVIEEFFKAIKTGCSYEKRQLEGLDQLLDALCLFLPIATKMLLMRTLERIAPETPATQVLDADHIEVLRETGPRTLPQNPNCRELMRAVAALGGFLGGPSKKPGWLVLARGMETLVERVAGWKAARDFYAMTS